jgi:aryl-alcohol dehydrogenase-like predicted oxidoreductase
MKLRSLGRSSLTVSSLGLGLAALGRPGYINLGHHQDLPAGHGVAEMEAHAHRVMDAAYEAGLRYFDAARSYGKAEQFLGTWLRKRGLTPGEVGVGSKWGYTYTADWRIDAEQHEVKDHSIHQLQQQWQESQAQLGDYLGLYQIHSATLETGVLANVEVLNHLAQLKREGFAIGLSLSGPRQADTLRQALEIRTDGVLLFDAVQATWNLLETSAGPALREAHLAGLGVIVKEALANGRLTPRNDDPQFAGQRPLLQQQADRLGVSIDALALAAAKARSWASVVLSGAATLDHLQSNLQAMQVNWDPEAEALLAPLAEDPDTYWQIRKRLKWN